MPSRQGQHDHESDGDEAFVRDGERYLNVERAAAYLGKKRSTLFNYLRRYGEQLGIETYRFPLFGKRVYFKQSDLDRLKHSGPLPRGGKASPPG